MNLNTFKSYKRHPYKSYKRHLSGGSSERIIIEFLKKKKGKNRTLNKAKKITLRLQMGSFSIHESGRN